MKVKRTLGILEPELRETAPGKKLHDKFRESLKHLEYLGNIKVKNNGKNAQKTQFKTGQKNWWKHNMKAVLIAFFLKNKDIVNLISFSVQIQFQ